uniref:Uncharacterized protein n=1 Tax=Magallana gigas TaxID=29159 RepID=K1R775_MAGGI
MYTLWLVYSTTSAVMTSWPAPTDANSNNAQDADRTPNSEDAKSHEDDSTPEGHTDKHRCSCLLFCHYNSNISFYYPSTHSFNITSNNVIIFLFFTISSAATGAY